MGSTDEERVASSATASTSSADPSPPAPPPPVEKKKKKFDPIEMPTPEVLAAQEFMNNCFVKSAMSGAMGGVAGLAFGLFMSSFENAHGGMDSIPDGTAQRSTRAVLKEMFTNMRTKSVSYAKGFAVMGALFSFNECVVEKWRAKHDAANPVIAGCVTGAMMAHSGGPQAMCFGCASFGAFSYVIEKYLNSDH
ncbi:hypothetical protein CHLRE_01g021050v5 [Chlamydomonas reinhardtii]|uniref:Uncharacterized protein n=1 Tax=Chlamydomonas reinhardtii TaxID=3055 RepID=A8HPV7_CHLRE|nr:uncharacterized protein CHLRE_01g021050v5 [Chlamydomonas reinhardtii]PNW88246.1 hypothetical protein CHLRE_01g021050v5 [Chlamydomonas reinhardtii]|eukprot:XP_001689511.1 mitochondrial inner membrane translocase [Chlamydomonas reinhardtii]